MISSIVSMGCVLATCLFYVNEPVVEMREKPDPESEVVSQALFSEEVKIKEEANGWSSLFTPDGYAGWVPSKSIVKRDFPYETDLKISRLSAHLYKAKGTEGGPLKSLPFGAKLHTLDATDPRWLKVALPDGRQCYIQRGDVQLEPPLSNKEELVEFSQRFLGLPYTWGGRSGFGYDCSGFMQMLYREIGVNLERDARMQINDHRFKKIEIEELERGDLIFFKKSEAEPRIMHVGLYIGNGRFIHATVRENKPWIRISHLSDPEWMGTEEAYYAYRTARQLISKS